MYFTLAQVRKALSVSGATGAYTTALVSGAEAEAALNDDINKAVRGLAGLSGWECLRRTVRFISAGPVFALPQGYAGLVRLCVNGTPTTLRGQDFRFLQSGPGDLRRPPRGFSPVPVRNVVDIGPAPVILEPHAPFGLLAFSDQAPEGAALSVTGVRPDGRMVHLEVPVRSFDDYDAPVDGLATVAKVEHVVVDGAVDYVSLYAVPDVDADVAEDRYQIACYNPEVAVPVFRRYEIPGVPPGRPVEVLAETRIDPVPLVRDTDVVPFESPVEPIEWMVRADWAMKSGEVTQAQNYRSQAMNWLKAREVADDTVQTQVVVNSVYNGSMGEVSEEADNI